VREKETVKQDYGVRGDNKIMMSNTTPITVTKALVKKSKVNLVALSFVVVFFLNFVGLTAL
jgi:hypothetical protein